ncbi:Hpt domain-containing protein, partial [Bacillus sp. JR_15]
MDVNQYLDIFLDESREHLQTCNEKLLDLEKNPTDLQLVNDIFRAAHTLKGMSATMGYADMAQLTHHLENMFDAIRNEQMIVTPESMDTMFEALDHLEAMVQSIAEGGDGKRDVTEISKKLDVTGSHAEAAPSVETAAVSAAAANDLDYNEFERTVLDEAREQGFKCYELNVTLSDACLLKAVRVYMIFERLNEAGEVVKTVPNAELLESEDFESEFSISYLSKQPMDEVKKIVMTISEVEQVEISEVSAFEEATPAEKQEAKPEQKKEEVSVPAAKVPANDAPKANGNNGSAAGGTKTIRVNIDR